MRPKNQGHGGKNMSRRGRFWTSSLVAAAILLFTAVAGASSLLSQSFVADGSLPLGSIVSLKKGTTDHVTAAYTDNSKYIFGVVVDSESSQLSVTNGQSNQVHVATSGIEQVLVSDINGNIEVGDPITASPIKAVGMKATSNAKIVGIAQDNFPNGNVTNESYKDGKGQKQTVKLGQMSVLVNVSYYYKQPDKTIIPSAIQNLANALAGRKVNALPVIISIGIFFVSLIVVVSIVYSMIHSSIISVGRNPMSQAAVYRNVVQLSILVLIILGVAVGSIYMVLTRF